MAIIRLGLEQQSMNAEERTKEIFSQALERKSPGERENFLAEACKDEPEMRSQVESLLRAHEQAGISSARLSNCHRLTLNWSLPER